jgi:L-alanine-DL-glutamate epimerase-like enolase superfamily enzyme
MKITSVRILRRACRFEGRYRSEARSVGPLDAYGDYPGAAAPAGKPPSPAEGEPGTHRGLFVEIGTDGGIAGEYGVIENRAELLTIMDGLAAYLLGRDPLENRMLWDIMSRFDRHSRSGLMMMAISALDIALWDLKGKILGQPVYKLLGGGRPRVRPYFSALGLSVEPAAARMRALEIKARGIRAQKWFFRYGPADGEEGIRRNLDLAFALRDALGEGYELMFDCWMGWTLSYAEKIFPELEKARPLWVEEVLRPQMLDGYRRLRDISSIPLSAGEHFYTRMEVNPYLRENIFAVMQSDPVWCGGITEALRIAELCEMYGLLFIPHGHALTPALHVVASMPPDVCPYCEYLLTIMDRKNAFFKAKLPGEDGWITLNPGPGLGEELDQERLISVETVRGFDF